MSESRPTLAVRLATTFLFFICMVAASQWCLNRFWLYHAQNRVLQPSDYTVSVAPAVSGSAADARLSDDGQFSVKVVTVGTSHAMDQVTNSLLPVFLLGAIGIAATLYVARRRDRQAL
jgi:hypothetical protein